MLRRLRPLSSRKNRSYCSSMYSRIALKLSELSMASPKPGVSTTVSLNFTPRSSISTVDASSFKVCFCFSASEIIKFLALDGLRSAYQQHRERRAPGTSRSGTANSPALTCPGPIRRQSSAWTRILSSPTCGGLGWEDSRIRHTRRCQATKTADGKKVRSWNRTKTRNFSVNIKIVISYLEAALLTSSSVVGIVHESCNRSGMVGGVNAFILNAVTELM